ALAARVLPLHPHLLGIRRAGPAQARPLARRPAYPQALPILQPLGRARPRPRSLTTQPTMKNPFSTWQKAALAMAVTAGGAIAIAAGDNYFEVGKNLEIFNELYKDINIYYVDDVNPGELITTGIDAMLESLDPYTQYIAESDMEDYRFMTTGQYGGIGAMIRKKDEGV